MTTLNLGNLDHFRLVVQRAASSAAADALGISQPAVSPAGTPAGAVSSDAADRTYGAGIKATAAGEALRVHGERLELAVEGQFVRFSAFNQEVSGTITPARRDGLYSSFPACCSSFVREYPCYGSE